MCKPDSIFCCRAYFLNKKQKQFVGLIDEEEALDDEEEYSSAVEKFITTVFAQKLLSFPGRITVLIAWVLLLVVAAFGVSQVSTGFSMELFIPEDSHTDKFF